MKTNFLRAVVGACMLMGTVASAHGVLLSPEALSPKVRETVSARIEQARQTRPQLFTQVQDVFAELPRLDAMKRGRVAPVSPILKKLGPEAVWPMLETLAFAAPERGALTDSAWFAWRLGLIEAVGMTREPSAALVLDAVLGQRELEAPLLRSAAEALGRIGDDASVAAVLRRVSQYDGAQQLAILSGMGNCRRLRTATYLANALDGTGEEARVLVLVKALGDVGNAGAWRTPVVNRTGEGDEVRQVAARSLVGAYLRFEGEIETAALKALLVVDSAQMPNILRAASEAASPAQRAKLERLQQKLAANPTRIRG